MHVKDNPTFNDVEITIINIGKQINIKRRSVIGGLAFCKLPQDISITEYNFIFRRYWSMEDLLWTGDCIQGWPGL